MLVQTLEEWIITLPLFSAGASVDDETFSLPTLKIKSDSGSPFYAISFEISSNMIVWCAKHLLLHSDGVLLCQ